VTTWHYRCGQCRATSPPVTRSEAERLRQEHRTIVHGGLVPDDEQLLHITAGRSAEPYVSTRAALIGLGILAAATGITRVLGH